MLLSTCWPGSVTRLMRLPWREKISTPKFVLKLDDAAGHAWLREGVQGLGGFGQVEVAGARPPGQSGTGRKRFLQRAGADRFRGEFGQQRGQAGCSPAVGSSLKPICRCAWRSCSIRCGGSSRVLAHAETAAARTSVAPAARGLGGGFRAARACRVRGRRRTRMGIRGLGARRRRPRPGRARADRASRGRRSGWRNRDLFA